MRTIAVLIALVLAPGCIPPSNPPPVSVPQSAPAATLPPERFRATPDTRGIGVDSLRGRDASALTERFGATRIDLREDDARKLQFVSQTCVLDVFLYPQTPGGKPVAAHAEARERVTGEQVDHIACMADIERARRR